MDDPAFEEAAALLEAGLPADAPDEPAAALDAAFGDLAGVLVDGGAAPEERAPMWKRRAPALMAFVRQSRAVKAAESKVEQLEAKLADLKKRSLLRAGSLQSTAGAVRSRA